MLLSYYGLWVGASALTKCLSPCSFIAKNLICRNAGTFSKMQSKSKSEFLNLLKPSSRHAASHDNHHTTEMNIVTWTREYFGKPSLQTPPQHPEMYNETVMQRRSRTSILCRIANKLSGPSMSFPRKSVDIELNSSTATVLNGFQ